MSQLIRKNRQVILTISDLHFPFQHKKALTFIDELVKEFKPETVICLGDHMDLYKLSRYAHIPESYNAADEIQMGLAQMQILYKILKDIKDVRVCNSNHSARSTRVAAEAGLPKKLMRMEKEWLMAPDHWEWGDFFNIKTRSGLVHFWHGEPYSSNNWHKAGQELHRHCVMGHVHSKAGVHYFKNRIQEVWTMNTGCLIDVDSYAFEYSKFCKAKPTIGTGIVINGVPTFHPLI